MFFVGRLSRQCSLQEDCSLSLLIKMRHGTGLYWRVTLLSIGYQLNKRTNLVASEWSCLPSSSVSLEQLLEDEGQSTTENHTSQQWEGGRGISRPVENTECHKVLKVYWTGKLCELCTVRQLCQNYFQQEQPKIHTLLYQKIQSLEALACACRLGPAPSPLIYGCFVAHLWLWFDGKENNNNIIKIEHSSGICLFILDKQPEIHSRVFCKLVGRLKYIPVVVTIHRFSGRLSREFTLCTFWRKI